MNNFNRHICECGKNLRELETKAIGVTPTRAGYPIDYYGGRVSLVKKDAKCECGRIMDLLFENIAGELTIIDKVVTNNKTKKASVDTDDIKEDVISKEEVKEEVEEVEEENMHDTALNNDTDEIKEEVKEDIKEVKKVSKK